MLLYITQLMKYIEKLKENLDKKNNYFLNYLV